MPVFAPERGELSRDRVELPILDLEPRGNDFRELGFRLLIDLPDARAGQDVVELVAEHDAPVRLE